MSDFLNLQGAKDLNTDAIHLSAVANSVDPATGSPIDTHVNRAGGTDYTLHGFWNALGPVVMPWTSVAGGTLTQPNQAFLHPTNGSYYSWTGAYPAGGYVVAPGTDPTVVAGYVPRTDVVLRSDLASGSGSGLVRYKPVGTGAVATTVQSKLLEFVSVKDFGAVGDGVTDDTAAIQAAVMANQNNVIIVPRGTYKLSGSIHLSTGQTIKGAGRNSTVFYCSDSFDAFVLASDYSGISDCGFTSPVARTFGAYVKIGTATRGNFVRNTKLTNAFYGLHIAANAVITAFEDVEIINTAPATGIGVFIAGGNDTFLNRIVMDAPADSQPLCGVRIKSSQATWMTDCDLIHQRIGIKIDPDVASDLVTWCFFQDVACDLGIGDGLHINPNNATVKGLFFDNCWFSSNLNGVNITKTGTGAVDGAYFDGCIFFNNKNRGAWNQAGVNIEFSSCKASGNSGSSSGTYAGIEFSNNCLWFAVRDSHSGAQAGFGATQSYGVLIGSGCNNYTITNNNFIANVTGAASDGSMATSTQREVSGNLGFKTSTSGTATVASGTNETTVTHNLAGSPTVAFAVPLNTNIGGLDMWCGSFKPSTFKINTSENATSDLHFSWTASLYN